MICCGCWDPGQGQRAEQIHSCPSPALRLRCSLPMVGLGLRRLRLLWDGQREWARRVQVDGDPHGEEEEGEREKNTHLADAPGAPSRAVQQSLHPRNPSPHISRKGPHFNSKVSQNTSEAVIIISLLALSHFP